MLDRGWLGSVARGGRGGEGQVDRHRRDQAQRGAGRFRRARRRDRPGRADHPARRRRAVAHPRARDPQEPGRDPRAVRARARPARPDRRAGRARRGRPRAPAGQVPVGPHGHQRRELRDGRDGHGLRVRVRGQRPHVHHAARGARDRDGDREARARLARHGGVRAAAAALVHRRADEPLHLVLDRGAAGRRAAGVPPRAARQRPHRRARRPGRSPGAALHPLLGLPERLPGLLAHRRARLRVRLSRADRGDPHPAARGPGEGSLAAVRLEPVRRVLRGLPGRDRHPARAGAPALAGGGHRAGLEAGKGGNEGDVPGFLVAAGVRDARSARRGSARARSPAAVASSACRGRCPAGPPRATCPSRRRRPSATGGSASAATATLGPRVGSERAKRQPSPQAAPAETGDARAVILGRIRSALGDHPPAVEVPRDYRRRSERSRAEVVDLFAERVGEYRAEVHRAERDELFDVLAAPVPRAGSAPPGGGRRPARGLPRGRRGARARRRALSRRSSTASTARSPAARSPSPRPA